MAARNRFLALLRGINVGGKNPLKMAELRAAFEQAGLADVSTYIQSGNVLFTAGHTDKGRLAEEVASLVLDRFGYELAVVVVSARDLKRAVDQAPDGFGDQPDKYLCDVIFLRPPLTAKQALAALELKEGVDEAVAGTGLVYFSRLAAKKTASRMGRIAGKPEYAEITIRSWKSTTKLHELMEA